MSLADALGDALAIGSLVALGIMAIAVVVLLIAILKALKDI